MASKKKSKIKVEGTSSKQRRAEELRELFNAPTTKTSAAIAVPSATQNTPTPTPTKTERSGVTAQDEKSKTHVYEQTHTKTQSPIRTVISTAPYQAAKRVDVRPRDDDEKTDWWLGPVLILAALLMLGLGWLHIERSGTIANPVGHSTSTLESVRRETRAKVDFYRKQLGHRLNQDRVTVEITNSRTAPPIDAGATKQVDRSMMSGAPLMQEDYVERNYGRGARDTQPVPVDRPDARIQYSLQEEQHRNEFDRRVQKDQIAEFVENARLDGVKVVLDADLNVIDVKPISASEQLSNSRKPGSSLPNVAH